MSIHIGNTKTLIGLAIILFAAIVIVLVLVATDYRVINLDLLGVLRLEAKK
jgi:hypothetical protein